MAKLINAILLLLTLILCGCANQFSQYDKSFGNALNNNLNHQKIKSVHAKDEQGQVTAQELAPRYDAFQQGRAVQSSAGEKLSTPMSSSNSNSQ